MLALTLARLCPTRRRSSHVNSAVAHASGGLLVGWAVSDYLRDRYIWALWPVAVFLAVLSVGVVWELLEYTGDKLFTIKKCPPVIDAMTYGFLMPLACDVTVEDGEFRWDRDVAGGIANYPRSPIDFHDPAQVAGTPFFDEDQFIIKFNSFWTIELPLITAIKSSGVASRSRRPKPTRSG